MTTTMYVNTTLIDGTGRDPIEGAALSVSEGRIRSVGTVDDVARTTPEDTVTIDLDGTFVMPGMIDCHFHGVYEAVSCFEDYDLRRPIEESTLFHARNAQTILQSGFTSAREVGTRGLVSATTSKLIAAGVLEGPRLVAGGRILGSTGGLVDAYGEWIRNEDALGVIVDGELAIRKAVREQIKHGIKCIKVEASGTGISTYAGSHKQTMSEEEIAAAVHEARRNGVRVACHAQGTESIKNAVRAGVTTVEHGSFLDEEGISLMKEKGTILTPTISVLYLYVHKGPEVGVPAWVVEKFRVDLDAHLESVKMAAEAGIPMIVGSDSGHAFNPQWGIASELAMMAENGLTPLEAITAATLNGAKAAGISKSVGSLEPGKLADFLVLDFDPIAHIEKLQDRSLLRGVYQGGVLKGGYERFQEGMAPGLRFYPVGPSDEHDEHGEAPFGGECLIPYEDL